MSQSRKKRGCLIALSIPIILLLGLYCFLLIKAGIVREFNVQDYREQIELYQNEYPGTAPQAFGEIKNALQAKRAAKKCWEPIYGTWNISYRRPYRVFWDEENGMWLVRGNSPFFWIASGPGMIIRASDGEVITYWNEKF